MRFNIQRFAGVDADPYYGPGWLYFVREGTIENLDEIVLEGDNASAEHYGIYADTEWGNALNPPFWGFVKDGGEITNTGTNNGVSTTDKDNVILKVYGVASINGVTIDEFAETIIEGDAKVEGNATAITVTASGELSDILVEGANKTALTITIDGTAYPVLADGHIVKVLPDFGLMSKADKLKLDRIPTDFSNFITGGEMTANGFVLTNSAGEGVVTIPAQA